MKRVGKTPGFVNDFRDDPIFSCLILFFGSTTYKASATPTKLLLFNPKCGATKY